MPDTWVFFGAGAILLLGALMWSLCRMAAQADRQVDELAERRRNRNGIEPIKRAS